jgi:hypothetical protein
MKPIDRFLKKPKRFWASVRSLSQQIGYSRRNILIVPSLEQMVKAYESLGLETELLFCNKQPTPFAEGLLDYFSERARILTEQVEPKLLNAVQAKTLFEKIRGQLNPTCPIPMNKQKGEKKAEAYLTALVNMMIEQHSGAHLCEYDPKELTSFTLGGEPLRTLARRVDGAFPTVINPIAIWEIKEYYYTTTFGSRVAGGVYETLLDGMELEELREHENIDVKHYLMVDAHFTWWKCGKSYLCRMFDMLHMGYVDEILFGREVVEEMPRIVSGWVQALKEREINSLKQQVP